MEANSVDKKRINLVIDPRSSHHAGIEYAFQQQFVRWISSKLGPYHPRKRSASFVILFLLLTTACSGVSGSRAIRPSSYLREAPSEYYIYFPEKYTENRTWPLFIGIHGAGGTGRDCWSSWQEFADDYGFILVCPSLADETGGWLQEAGEEKLINIINSVYREASVRNQVFLVGFSAGAQFVQGFAFSHARFVSGVSVLSSGNFYSPPANTSSIPFLVIVGETDNDSRVEGARQFSENLRNLGYFTQFHILPNVAHEISPEARKLTISFFNRVLPR